MRREETAGGEAIQQPLARILVGGDGSITIEAQPGGLLGLDGNFAQLECREELPLLGPRTLAAGERQWKLIAQVESLAANR
jgi:hypothetical protein